MGPIETVCLQIMSSAASVSGDSNRAAEPYYRYGSKWYEANDSVYPQVRIRKLGFGVSDPMLKGGPTSYDSTVSLSGSIGTIDQDIEVMIWGEDELQVLTEFKFFCLGVNEIKNANVEGIGQLALPESITNGQWVDDSARVTLGEAITFQYTIKANIPERATTLKLLSSSIQFVSQSSSLSGSLSGSIEGSKHFVLTSSL